VDRRRPKHTLLGIGIGLTIVIIAVCGYVFDWAWTGLANRTFWDWLRLLVVPVVLALGGYLFNQSESRRARQEAAEQHRVEQELTNQRAQTDREIAEQGRQDAALQAYLDHIGELLLDNDKALRKSAEGDEVRTLARARTLTVLRRLDGERKARVMQFLYEAGLIRKDANLVDLKEADLHGALLSDAHLSQAYLVKANLGRANLDGANLAYANLSEAVLSEANLIGADLSRAILDNANLSGAEGITNEELEQQAASLKGATMPNGQKYEDWLKSSGEDRENGNIRNK
jgi:uncharacterized protein YjbI with pentapeptide repeats